MGKADFELGDLLISIFFEGEVEPLINFLGLLRSLLDLLILLVGDALNVLSFIYYFNLNFFLGVDSYDIDCFSVLLSGVSFPNNLCLLFRSRA